MFQRKRESFCAYITRITSVNCRQTQSKGKIGRNLKKSGGSGNDLPLQNVLVVKGGESNADNTQVRRISAAGDGHLRRRGLSLSFVQTEQPRGRRGRLSGSLSPAAAGRHRFPRHRTPESMAGGTRTAGRSANRGVAALCGGLPHRGDRGNGRLPSGNGTHAAASRKKAIKAGFGGILR